MVRTKRGDRNRVKDVVDVLIWKKLQGMESCRYLYRNRHRRAQYNKFVIDADSTIGSGNVQPHLNEREFRVKYRMSRVSFCKLLSLIKHHPVFFMAFRKKQASVNVFSLTHRKTIIQCK